MYGIVGAYQTQGKNAQALKKLWEGICSGLHHNTMHDLLLMKVISQT